MSGLSDDTLAVGTWLRQQREKAGLTQEELADRSGLSVRAISSLERDRTRRPHPDTLRRVARALDLGDAAVGELIACYRAGRYREPSPGGERGWEAVVPRQLPATSATFAGRTAELAVLDGWLACDGAAGAVVISAIGGMAGVGKSALALHWARRVATRFPGGQLYANLRGYAPADHPADAAEVVRGFLEGLGVAPERIPADLDGRTALYRSVLAGRRILIVADNAQNPAQVRPLLPGGQGSVVLVTSRSQLGGLAAAEGARVLNLDVLTEADAAELLSARLGRARVSAEPEAVAVLIRLCGRLPLALAIVAARADLSGWPLAVLAGQLAGARERLGLLGLGDPAADVRAVFSWSFRQLGSEPARMFRLLASHPGPDISIPAAASLAAVPLPRAQALLSVLAEASIVAERVPGRYLLHDLLRAYAAEQSEQSEQAEPDGEDAAARRVLDFYLHTAQAAARALDPAQPAPGPGVTGEAIAGGDDALAWFGAEQKVLLAVIAQASRSGHDDYAKRIARTLEPFFEASG